MQVMLRVIILIALCRILAYFFLNRYLLLADSQQQIVELRTLKAFPFISLIRKKQASWEMCTEYPLFLFAKYLTCQL